MQNSNTCRQHKVTEKRINNIGEKIYSFQLLEDQHLENLISSPKQYDVPKAVGL